MVPILEHKTGLFKGRLNRHPAQNHRPMVRMMPLDLS